MSIPMNDKIADNRPTPRELLERYRYQGKITPQFRKQACEIVRHGTPIRNALKALGAADSTVRTWESWANEEEEGGKHREFWRELQCAWDEWVSFVAMQGEKHVQKDGRTWRDTAAALMPEYEKRDRLDVNVEIDASPTFKAIAEAQQKLIAGQWKVTEDTLSNNQSVVPKLPPADGTPTE